ncbi:uncharacterized protein BJ212DRAFT_1072632 [Suillus subaureus]|uniref:Secreted protein n=1 Tax=Suillus subaureus TaxID=48587 RepID=A0A9P7J478_9AGAM|nr:uncharacterized protein BJ212DRAFT_1072632 [Suillus subaureus]KAG1801817.1 hypothetical protein BJ212DRAFT_1072632 [Suillus subaureus]
MKGTRRYRVYLCFLLISKSMFSIVSCQRLNITPEFKTDDSESSRYILARFFTTRTVCQSSWWAFYNSLEDVKHYQLRTNQHRSKGYYCYILINMIAMPPFSLKEHKSG